MASSLYLLDELHFGEIIMLMSLFQTPPDTTSYMIGGFVVFFGVMLVYLVSYFLRFKNLRADLEMLDEIDSD